LLRNRVPVAALSGVTATNDTHGQGEPDPTGNGDMLHGHEAEDIDTVEESDGADKVVFGVSGALAIAFLVWDFVSTDSLGTASTSALDWVIVNTGWGSVLLASVSSSSPSGWPRAATAGSRSEQTASCPSSGPSPGSR